MGCEDWRCSVRRRRRRRLVQVDAMEEGVEEWRMKLLIQKMKPYRVLPSSCWLKCGAYFTSSDLLVTAGAGIFRIIQLIATSDRSLRTMIQGKSPSQSTS